MAGVLAGAAVASCAVVSEPVVVQGTLVDTVGQPVPGVVVVLDALDQRLKNPGDTFEQFEVQTTTRADGTFEFRFPPSDRLRQLAGTNAPAVSFTVAAFDPRRRLTWTWSFSRELGSTGWEHDPTPVRLPPVGAGI